MLGITPCALSKNIAHGVFKIVVVERFYLGGGEARPLLLWNKTWSLLSVADGRGNS